MRFFTGIVFFLIAHALHGQSVLELAGHWTGSGNVTVDWCDTKTLAFDISISTDGDISGKVGDAMILAGDVKKDKTDNTYFLHLKLKGDIVECEHIKRIKLTMELQRNDDILSGIFYSEGKFFGNAETGILTGNGVVMKYN